MKKGNIILICLGILIAAFGIYLMPLTLEFQKNAVRVEALIVRVGMNADEFMGDNGVDVSYNNFKGLVYGSDALIVRYVYDGIEYESELNEYDSSVMRVGETIELLINPARPEIVKYENMMMSTNIGIILVGIFIVCLEIFMYKFKTYDFY